MNKKIAIVGCGWIGKALTNVLVQHDYVVVASTRSKDNFSTLAQLGAEPVELALPNKNIAAFSFLSQVDTLVISLTPQFKQGKTDYPEKVRQLVQFANEHKVNRIILLSSTGIYQGLQGEVNETAKVDVIDSKVALLNEAEQHVLSAGQSTCVLRLAGLIGPKRHPARFMAGKTNLANPLTPINLVHQTDVVNAILLMIAQVEEQGIYNVVSDTHPSRQRFYQHACQQLQLSAPSFSEEQETMLRVVVNDKIKALGLDLVYPDLMHWLENE